MYVCMGSGVGGGGEEGAGAPPKVLFCENPGKIRRNLDKTCENLWNFRKIPENLGKDPENTGKPTCFYLNKMAPNMYRTFFGGHPKNGVHEKIFAQ